VNQKIRRLRLEVVRQIPDTTTFDEELPSVEQALKTLNKALQGLETKGLEQAETLRFRGIIQGVKIYIERFADFLNYRELEQRLIELEGKYVALVKKTKKS